MSTPLKEILHLDALPTAPARFRLLHVFGALAVLLLLVEVLSGVLLLAYYRPIAAAAFSSIGIIVDEVWLGWLIRSLHVWCADFLILFSVLHLIRVYFAHAYQAPRQPTWTMGILLLFTLFAFSLSGTLLPWDQYAYWSTEAARQTIAAVPVVGNVVLDLLWGGWAIGEEVLLRFYVFHIGILPWVAALFLWLHLLLVWRNGLTDPVLVTRRQHKPPAPFFPDFVLNLLIAVLLIFGGLISVATLFPPAVTTPADPLTPLAGVQPRWYFVVPDEVLRSLPGPVGSLVVIGVFLVLLLVPVADGRPDRSRWRPLVRWTFGVVVLVACILLLVKRYLA
jgi:ubiquinol-cytochrome c reductase cytochrome b subunit